MRTKVKAICNEAKLDTNRDGERYSLITFVPDEPWSLSKPEPDTFTRQITFVGGPDVFEKFDVRTGQLYEVEYGFEFGKNKSVKDGNTRYFETHRLELVAVNAVKKTPAGAAA